MIDTEATNNNVGLSIETKDLDDESDIMLYTTATHGGTWLIEVIDASFFLIKKIRSEHNDNPKPIHVEILLLPVGPYQQNPLTSLLIRFIKFFLKHLPNIIKKRLPEKLKSISSSLPEESFYNQIYSGKKVQLHHDQDTLTFSLFNTLSLRYALTFYSSYISSISLWLSCYQGRHFIAQKFLKLKYQHIHIGDLVASHTLRVIPQLAGSLQPCFKLFQYLTYAIGICNLCTKLPIHKNKQTYVIVPEQTYLQIVYSRHLHYSGVNIIELNSYYKKISIISSNQIYTNPFIAQPHPSISNNNELSQIENYLNKRIFESNASLWYMYDGQNDNTSTEIRDIYGNKIDLIGRKLYVVIFLHSFSDGLYFYGLDGFDDLYQWTTFTIDSCLKNLSINMIFIKPHPNVDVNLYPADKYAIERLIRHYSRNERVIFIDKFSSLILLAKKIHFYGITHHGSIAEELVYLRQPVIASAFAPWHSNYSFVRTWKNPTEYASLLDSLSIETWSVPSESEMDSLYAFIQEYRLNDYQKLFPIHKAIGWIKFLQLYPGNIDLGINPENYTKSETLFQKITCDDPIFQEFIQVLADSNFLSSSKTPLPNESPK